MCAQFMVKAKIKDIEKKFHIQKHVELEWDERVLPYRKAPVIVDKGLGPEVRLMNFSLIPSWSKEARMKFATHNARLETIDEKATWKKPFHEHRCLVPLTDFIEPIYEGELGGNMVSFSSSQTPILAAAGIWSEWLNKATGEVIESFAIITSDPCEFIKTVGHDRQPVFLGVEQFSPWINPKPLSTAPLKAILQHAPKDIPFQTAIDRPLKKKSK